MSKTTLSVRPTRRQYQVMTMIGCGFRLTEIASRLKLSYQTNIGNKFQIEAPEIRGFVISQKWVRFEIKPYDEIEPIPIEYLMRRDF